ncbi:hypothetical protein Trisim1_008221 [Trichoderma cf. simile WF8]
MFCVPVCCALGCKAESPFEPDSDTVKMRTDTKLLLSAMASFQLPTACYRMLSKPWRSRPYMRTGELTLRSLLPLTSSALVAVR